VTNVRLVVCLTGLLTVSLARARFTARPHQRVRQCLGRAKLEDGCRSRCDGALVEYAEGAIARQSKHAFRAWVSASMVPHRRPKMT
jgi:hypothetical protein